MPTSKKTATDIVDEAVIAFNGKEVPMIKEEQAKGLQTRLDNLTETARQAFKKEFKHDSIARLEKRLLARVTKFVSKLEKEAKAA